MTNTILMLLAYFRLRNRCILSCDRNIGVVGSDRLLLMAAQNYSSLSFDRHCIENVWQMQIFILIGSPIYLLLLTIVISIP